MVDAGGGVRGGGGSGGVTGRKGAETGSIESQGGRGMLEGLLRLISSRFLQYKKRLMDQYKEMFSSPLVT